MIVAMQLASAIDALRRLVSVSRITRGLRVTPALSDAPRLEVNLKPMRQLGFKFSVQGDEYGLALHLPGVSAYATAYGSKALAERIAVRNKWPAHSMVTWGAQGYYDPDAMHHVVTYDWEHNAYDSSYTSRDPRRHGYHAIEDFVFGPLKITRKTLWKGPVSVPMPEGVYEGRGKLQRIRHWRPRWPGPWGVFFLESVEVPQGVEHPNGGPLYGVSPAGRAYRGEDGAHEAIGAFVATALKERGGAAWRPKPRVRRVFPFTRPLRWESRDPLTGTWSTCGSGQTIPRHLGSIDEPSCGCCHAKYGAPCTDKACANIGLRRENKT